MNARDNPDKFIASVPPASTTAHKLDELLLEQLGTRSTPSEREYARAFGFAAAPLLCFLRRPRPPRLSHASLALALSRLMDPEPLALAATAADRAAGRQLDAMRRAAAAAADSAAPAHERLILPAMLLALPSWIPIGYRNLGVRLLLLQDQPQTIAIGGPRGTGKRTLARALHRAFVADGRAALYATAAALDRRVAESDAARNRTHEQLAAVDLLTIDGADVAMQDAGLLESVVDLRFSEGRSTVLLADVGGDALAARVGPYTWETLVADGGFHLVEWPPLSELRPLDEVTTPAEASPAELVAAGVLLQAPYATIAQIGNLTPAERLYAMELAPALLGQALFLSSTLPAGVTLRAIAAAQAEVLQSVELAGQQLPAEAAGGGND